MIAPMKWVRRIGGLTHGQTIPPDPSLKKQRGERRLRVLKESHMSSMKRPNVMLIFVFVALVSAPFSASAQSLSPNQQFAHEIYKELVEINTVTPTGDTAEAAEAMAARLRGAGYTGADLQVFNPAPRKGNLVARLHGTGARKPILLMAHIDVVEAKREDWSVDPFKLLEKDGYFYARGSGDDKFMAATFVANMIRYKQEGYKPDRDIILLLETDEEILDANSVGVQWMLKNHRDLIDAEFALNEGGGVGTKNGKALRNSVQTSEKVPVNYSFEVKNSGGHSSVPRKDNAIYELVEGLSRLSKYDFPVVLNETTRAWLERAAPLEDPETGAAMNSVASGRPDPVAVARLSAMPSYNAQLRTTCVATMLEAGHAFNALPQRAQATVQCRVLPGEPIEEVQKTLVRVVDDGQISVTPRWTHVYSKPSPLTPEILQAVEKVTAQFWPGVPVIPTMSSGATDGSFLRNAGIPTYGTSGLASDIDDVRAHGKDERVLIKSFNDGQEYLYRLVKALSSSK
jgi:acetylornithine deacetylase/succinyl-diaminopimelate desuccinylase-like protein